MSQEWNKNPKNSKNPMNMTKNLNLMNRKMKQLKKPTTNKMMIIIIMMMMMTEKTTKKVKLVCWIYGYRVDGVALRHWRREMVVKHTTRFATRKNIGSRYTVVIVATAASIPPTTANTREKNVFGGDGIIITIDFQAEEAALSILHSMVSAHSDLDNAGEIVTPTPRIKRILSIPRCIPHIAQIFAALRKAIVTRNPKSMRRLYSTGGFYFALIYPGSNLLLIARLFSVTHVHQTFHGVEEAPALSSSFPLARWNVLAGGLPASLLYVMERSGAAAMVSDSDSPEIVWTHKMRAENLIPQVLQHHGDFPQNFSQLCHSLYDYAPMPPVTYPELSDEMWCHHRYYLRNLCVEIRFSNWPIVKHVESLQSLLVFRREELTRRPMNLSKAEACKTLEIACKSSLSHSPNTSELQSGTDDGSIDEHHVSDDSLPITDVKVTAKEDFDLIKNLRFGLNTLQNLLTSDPNLASVFSSNEQLLPLFECFSISGASESNIPQLCLSALPLLTVYAPCLEAMIGDGYSLLLLRQMLHSSTSCHEGTLHVLCALASTPELTWASSKHGGVVYILELLFPLQEEIPLQQRAAAASLLGKLVGQPIYGPRVAITLARFIPDGLVSVIRDWPGEAVVSSLEQTTETEELIWTPAMAASISAQIATMASDLYLDQMKGRIVESEMPEQCQQEMRDEPQLPGFGETSCFNSSDTTGKRDQLA